MLRAPRYSLMHPCGNGSTDLGYERPLFWKHSLKDLVDVP